MNSSKLIQAGGVLLALMLFLLQAAETGPTPPTGFIEELPEELARLLFEENEDHSSLQRQEDHTNFRANGPFANVPHANSDPFGLSGQWSSSDSAPAWPSHHSDYPHNFPSFAADAGPVQEVTPALEQSFHTIYEKGQSGHNIYGNDQGQSSSQASPLLESVFFQTPFNSGSNIHELRPDVLLEQGLWNSRDGQPPHNTFASPSHLPTPSFSQLHGGVPSSSRMRSISLSLESIPVARVRGVTEGFAQIKGRYKLIVESDPDVDALVSKLRFWMRMEERSGEQVAPELPQEPVKLMSDFNR
nr:uncharacterized protein BN887_05070 [Melanopsichium pennsylvanicum 4]